MVASGEYGGMKSGGQVTGIISINAHDLDMWEMSVRKYLGRFKL
jgi:hypothetical protein